MSNIGGQEKVVFQILLKNFIHRAKENFSFIQGKRKADFVNSLQISQPGLCYHSIGDQIEFSSHIHHVSSNNFYDHLESLKRIGVTFLEVEEFLEEKKKRSSHKISTITFDDGYKNNLLSAVPILEALDVPFTLFICSKLLEGNLFWRDKVRLIYERNLVSSFNDWLRKNSPQINNLIDFDNFYSSSKKPPLNSKDVEKNIDRFLEEQNISTKQDGLYLSYSDLDKFPSKLVTFGNHTHNHYKLSTLSIEEQAEEISLCSKILACHSISVSDVFAIPFGEMGSFNQITLQLLKDFYFTGFFMTNQHQFGQRISKIPLNTYDLKYSNRILPKNNRFMQL